MTLASELFARRMHLVRAMTTKLVVERDLAAEMDDGTVLLADRWVAAAEASRPQPTVLVRSPYGRRQFVGLLFGWARCSAPSFDIFARLCDVDAAGVSRNVCDALASVSPDRDEREPDGTVRLRFELWPLGHRFAAGHRIRLQISSGAYPRYARNPGTGEDPATAAPSSLRAAEIEILRDGAHPSSVTLPVMDSRPPRSAGSTDGDVGAAPS